jgi:hypothetical protein
MDFCELKASLVCQTSSRTDRIQKKPCREITKKKKKSHKTKTNNQTTSGPQQRQRVLEGARREKETKWPCIGYEAGVCQAP